MKKLSVVVLLCPYILFGQSLSKERIQKLKNCVVKVVVEGGSSVGTGFFISVNGEVLTCWHVIQDAIKTDSLGQILDVKHIYAEKVNKEVIEMKIPIEYFIKKNINAVSYDFCVLSPAKPSITKTDFLRLGTFEEIEEGDEIYTAGYPLGLPNQFISKGILSTKYIDSSIVLSNKNQIKRSVALLDLTINKGNSGGPIIMLGKNINEDKVIGIADFLITRNGPVAETLIKELNDRKMDIKIDDGKGNLLYLTEIFKIFAEAIAYSSNGISGCVSINHFLQSSK